MGCFMSKVLDGWARAGRPQRARALTRLELLVVILVLAAILLFVCLRAGPGRRYHTLSKRVVCAANLRMIGINTRVYAANHGGRWPMVGFDETADHIRYTVPVGGGAGTVTSPDRTQPSRSGPGGATELSPTRVFWLAVRSGDLVNRRFICPSSEDVDDPSEDISVYYDFMSGANVSYGLQVPFGPAATRARGAVDNRLAVAADKGPYKDALVATPPPELSVEAKRRAWQPFNSRNHHGEGQNVLFADGHVTFARTPTAGIDHDNIYTVALDNVHLAARAAGESPWMRSAPPFTSLDPDGEPMASTDSVIFP